MGNKQAVPEQNNPAAMNEGPPATAPQVNAPPTNPPKSTKPSKIPNLLLRKDSTLEDVIKYHETAKRPYEEIFTFVVVTDSSMEKLAIEIFKANLLPDINDMAYGPNYNCSPLQLAIRNYLPDLALTILEHPDLDPNLGELDKTVNPPVLKMTPLIEAMHRKELGVVRTLLANAKLDLDRRFREEYAPGGWSPLLVCIDLDCGDDLFEQLLQFSKIDVNAQDKDDQTALLKVCRSGNRQLFNLLLKDKRVDVNLADKNGHSPLFFSARFNREDFVMALLEHPDIEVNHEDEKKAALFIACANKHIDMITILIRHGADPAYLPDTYSYLYEEYLVWRQAKSARNV